MATLLDTMVLELGLDASGFRRAEREAQDELTKFHESVVESGKEIEAGGKKVGEFFISLKRGALGLGAAFLGGAGFEHFINNMTRLDAATNRTARNIGMNVVELRAWQNVARETGGTAEGITASLTNLNDQLALAQMGRPNQLTALLRTTGINPWGKDPGSLLSAITQWVEQSGMKPNFAAPFLKQLGMDENAINLILLGTKALSERLDVQRRQAAIMREAGVSAEAYQKALTDVELAANALGETLFVKMAPGLIAFLDGIQKSFPFVEKLAAAFGAVASNIGGVIKALTEATGLKGFTEWLSGKFSGSSLQSWMGSSVDPLRSSFQQSNALVSSPYAGGTAGMTIPRIGGDPRHLESFIRERALAFGIDPNVAMTVARSEGLSSFFGDQGTSFGAFQLHLTPGGRGHAVGDDFRRETGLDPSDPRNERATIEFALARAAQRGWGPWMGAARSGIFGFTGVGRPGGGANAVPYLNSMQGRQSSIGGGSTSNSTNVSISNLNIHTQATDARGIARDIKPELERWSVASQANGIGGIV